MSSTGWISWKRRLKAPHQPAVSSQKTTATPRQKRTEGLDSPVTVIKGISTSAETKFAKLNVRTVHDLLYFFPRRYVDYSQRKPISELIEGEEQTIIGTIWQARVAMLGNRQGTEAILGDETGNIRAVWFNQPYLAKSFRTNARIVLSGTVGIFKGHKVFESPEWELLGDKELIHTGRMVPVYPLTQGLYPRQVRKWTKETVDGYVWQLSDFLPPEIKTRCQLLDLPTAIAQIHYPDDQTMAGRARGRLSFDELLLLQLGVLAKKRDWQESQPGNAFHIDQEVISRFLQLSPFYLDPGARAGVAGNPGRHQETKSYVTSSSRRGRQRQNRNCHSGSAHSGSQRLPGGINGPHRGPG